MHNERIIDFLLITCINKVLLYTVYKSKIVIEVYNAHGSKFFWIIGNILSLSVTLVNGPFLINSKTRNEAQ